MTGSYPDIPGTRFDLARDGSLVSWRYGGNPPNYLTPTQIAAGMDTAWDQGIATHNGYMDGNVPAVLTILFPEPRQITGLFWNTDRNGDTSSISPSATYSLDTTDGQNGTWTAFTGTGGGRLVGTAMGAVIPAYRSAIAAANVPNVKAIRLQHTPTTAVNNGSIWFRAVHIYGNRAIAGVDRLAFWHPTLDQELPGAYFDFGDVARGSVTGAKTFRIKNLSTTKAATALQVQAASHIGSPLPSPGAVLSADATAWAAATPAINLAAGAVSPVYSCRLNLSDVLALPQARSARLSTIVGSYA